MKTKYEIDQKVYALNTYTKDGIELPISIEIARIKSIHIYRDLIQYQLTSYYTNEGWGDTILEAYISDNIQDLIPKLDKEINK